jgi:hypothetical protein
MNSYFIMKLNRVGNASSLLFNISESSVNATTTTLNKTVPFTEKSLCPPIPLNLSKYFENFHFIFLFCWLFVHIQACNEIFECILLPLP